MQIENFECQYPPVSNAEEPRLVGLQDGTGAIDCRLHLCQGRSGL